MGARSDSDVATMVAMCGLTTTVTKLSWTLSGSWTLHKRERGIACCYPRIEELEGEHPGENQAAVVLCYECDNHSPMG